MAGMKKDAEVELLVLPRPKNFIDMPMESRSDTRLLSQLSTAPPRFVGQRLGSLQTPDAGPGFLLALTAVPEMRRHVRSLGALLELRSDPLWEKKRCLTLLLLTLLLYCRINTVRHNELSRPIYGRSTPRTDCGGSRAPSTLRPPNRYHDSI